MVPESFPSESFVQQVLDAFYGDDRNKGISLPKAEELSPVIRSIAREMMLFERSIGIPGKRIELVWIVSGPGSWFEATKDDRYAIYEWARWMDRQRIETGVAIARATIANDLAVLQQALAQDDLLYASVDIFYNGRQDEVASFRQASALPEFGFPRKRVSFSDGYTCGSTQKKIETTADNVASFREWYRSQKKAPQGVTVVTHAPQMSRLLRILNKQEPTGLGGDVHLFPLPTSIDGREEYMRRDIQSTLAHIFITGEASIEPYPYIL